MKLWKNGIFYTMYQDTDIVTKVLTHQGKIIALNEEVNHYKPDEIIDLNGGYVFPGFNDNHMHLLGYGKSLFSLNVFMNPSKEEVLKQIKPHINHELFRVVGYLNVGITKFDLDLISKDQVILLRHNDFHSFTVNSYALNLCGITHETGIMIELEAQPFEKLWAQESDQDLRIKTKKGIEQLHKYGITSIVTDDLSYYHSYLDTLKIINDVTKETPLRANLLVHHQVLEDYVQDSYKSNLNNPYLSFGWVKVFYDGTFSSKTAYLMDFYKNENHHGYSMGQDNFELVLNQARQNHLGIAVHTIGDKALYEVVESIKKYPPKKGFYDRIIHASLANEKIIQMMKGMPVILDIQSQFISSDLPRVLDIFNQVPMIYPLKSYLDAQILTVGSSDAPIEIPDPLLGISISESREIDHKIYQKEQRLSRFESIRIYTKDGILNPHINRGHIDVSYLADFTVFDKDLMTCSKEELTKAKVLMTVIDEKIVYQK